MRVKDRFAFANYVVSRMKKAGAPEALWPVVKTGLSIAINPRVVPVEKSGGWLESTAVLAIPRRPTRGGEAWRWTLVALRRCGDRVDLVGVPAWLPVMAWEALWAAALSDGERGAALDGVLCDEVRRLARHGCPEDLDGICTVDDANREFDPDEEWEPFRLHDYEHDAFDISGGLQSLRPPGWEHAAKESLNAAVLGMRGKLGAFPGPGAGTWDGWDDLSRTSRVGMWRDLWEEMFLAGWQTIIWEWLRRGVPERERKLWHALAGCPITNPNMYWGGTILVTLMSGTDEARFRKRRMVRRYPLGAGLWLLGKEGRRLVEAGAKEKEIWARATDTLCNDMELGSEEEWDEWGEFPWQGLRRLCRSQWGQRAGRVDPKLLGLAAAARAEYQPRSRVDWLEWRTADEVVSMMSWERMGEASQARAISGFHATLAKSARGLSTAEREARCARVSFLAGECRDALRQIESALSFMRRVDEAAAKEALAPVVGPLSLARITKIARAWTGGQLALLEFVERRAAADREEREWSPVEWVSPPVDLSAVRVLTTPEALFGQGKAQVHCVGGFTPQCLLATNNYHIYAVGDPETTGATLGLVESRGGSMKVAQFLGRGNSVPDEAMQTLGRRVLGLARKSVRDGAYCPALARQVRAVMAERNAASSSLRAAAWAAGVLLIMMEAVPGLRAFMEGLSRREA